MKFKLLFGLFTILFSSMSIFAAPTMFEVIVQNHLSATHNSQDNLYVAAEKSSQVDVEKSLYDNALAPGKQTYGSYSIRYLGQNNDPIFPVLISAPHLSSSVCIVDVRLNYNEHNGRFYISDTEVQKGKPAFSCNVSASGKNLIINADPINLA